MTTLGLVAVWLLVGIVLFELLEHVVLPLVFAFASRSRRPTTGAEAMPGRRAEVRQWAGSEGYVQLEGELWRAASASPLASGDRVVVRAVDGLTLSVEPESPVRRRR